MALHDWIFSSQRTKPDEPLGKNINTKVKPHYSKKFLELFERSICTSQDVANSNRDITKKTANEKLFTEIAQTLPISDSEVEETPTSTTDDFVDGESSKSFYHIATLKNHRYRIISLNLFSFH